MTTFRISELARRSGVPATTLRFYEAEELLTSERSPAGYRLYGQGAVDRLAFISSAKLLGLPLGEIRTLLGIWDDGACSTVRSGLIGLVEAQLAESDRRRLELAEFSARLASARRQLSRPAPDGACGPDCGCVIEVAAPGPVAVELTRRPMDDEAWRRQPIACTLGPAELAERTGDWRRVAARARERVAVEDGVRLRFDLEPGLPGEVAELAAAEQGCCSFLDFALQISGSELVLTVRAPEAAAGLLADLLGPSS